MLSIIIPSRTEKFLNRTIQDVLEKAIGEIEVFPVLDGYGNTSYEKIIDKRVKYISLPKPDDHERHKRQGINAAVSISKGRYVMWLDAHCVVAKGFDEVLKRDCQEDWVVIPRRYPLDIKKWDKKDLKGHLPQDYRYWRWSILTKEKKLAQYRWGRKTLERWNIPIDDIFCAQGSLFFMTRKWFDKCGFMKTEGYMGWGQEGEEVCMTTLLNGGRVVIDKNTWYAHLGKEQMKKRMYKWVTAEPSFDYSYNYWVHEQKEFFISVINRFMPIPNYPPNWEEILYGNT